MTFLVQFKPKKLIKITYYWKSITDEFVTNSFYNIIFLLFEYFHLPCNIKKIASLE